MPRRVFGVDSSNCLAKTSNIQTLQTPDGPTAASVLIEILGAEIVGHQQQEGLLVFASAPYLRGQASIWDMEDVEKNDKLRQNRKSFSTWSPL